MLQFAADDPNGDHDEEARTQNSSCHADAEDSNWLNYLGRYLSSSEYKEPPEQNGADHAMPPSTLRCRRHGRHGDTMCIDGVHIYRGS
jgi:hypothetical protein